MIYSLFKKRNVIFGVSEKWVKNTFYQLNNMEYLNYKNFRGTIEYSPEDKTHFGKIAEIKFFLSWEAPATFLSFLAIILPR